MLAVLALAARLGVAVADGPPPPPSSAAFERLKALAGDWVAAEDTPVAKKGQLAARYVLTASGSALVETVFPGSPHEMLTVYTADGDDVVLTHYCMIGNQPRMRAKPPGGSRYEFAFDGGAGIDAARDAHMHQAWIDLVGKDELRSEWTEHDGGKVKMVVGMHLVRKAS